MLLVYINPEIVFVPLDGGDDIVINLVFPVTMVQTAETNVDVLMENRATIFLVNVSAHLVIQEKTATPCVHLRLMVRTATLSATAAETQYVTTLPVNVCASLGTKEKTVTEVADLENLVQIARVCVSARMVANVVMYRENVSAYLDG